MRCCQRPIGFPKFVRDLAWVRPDIRSGDASPSLRILPHFGRVGAGSILMRRCTGLRKQNMLVRCHV